MIIGIDECGLGAIAGPLVVCAFMVPDEDWKHEGINDSKKLSRKRREELRNELVGGTRTGYIVQRASSSEVDEQGVEVCLVRLMNSSLEALMRLVGAPDRVIIDGEQKAVPGADFIPKADGLYPCVMAASIVGKVYHDEYMTQLAELHPQWGFDQHMGYPTSEHKAAIAKHGICSQHRRSYRPVAEAVKSGK